MSHTCDLPDAATFARQAELSEDWRDEFLCCTDCGRWWHVTEDYCYECGRTDGPIWTKTSAPTYGPQRDNGEHYLKPPPAVPFFWFPRIAIRRGGILYGSEPPRGPSWVERDTAIKADYNEQIKANDRARATPDKVDAAAYGIVAAGGWCAPVETTYDMGDTDG